MLPFLAVISGGLGIILLWLLLRQFFTTRVSAVTIVLIIFGTNYFQKIFFEGSTPHNYLFTLFAAVLLFTVYWQQSGQWVWILLMLPAVLLASYIHGLSMFIMFFPVFYGIFNKESLALTFKQVRIHPIQYAMLLLIILLAIVLTRFSWFAEPGTEFYFGDRKAGVYPWIAANAYLILFSFNKGWLVYTPMALLFLPGMYLLAERNRNIFYGIFLFFVFWFLLSASHPMWATGRGFGQRFFIETYAILALPLGYFIQWVFDKKLWVTILMMIVPSLFLLLNLFQTWQYHHQIISQEQMNRRYYFAVFGKRTVEDEDHRLLNPWQELTKESIPQDVQYGVTRIGEHHFEPSGVSSQKLTSEIAYSQGFGLLIKNITGKGGNWIRVRGWFKFAEPGDNQG